MAAHQNQERTNTFVLQLTKQMERSYAIKDVNQYNIDNGQKTLHPLVTVIDFSKTPLRDWGEIEKIKFQYGLYCIYLKDVKCGDLRYGRAFYDYQAGTLAFLHRGKFLKFHALQHL
jgi:hypothetical protein